MAKNEPMFRPEDEPEARVADVEPAPTTALQSALGWIVLAGLVAMFGAFCVVLFGQLMIDGWIGEQTEAWFQVSLIAGVIAFVSAITLIVLRGRAPRG